MRQRSTRRLALLAVIPAGVVLVALLYMLGMNTLEGEPRDFWQSLAWAAETMTTTGYGHDNQWRHPAMIVLVVAVQFAGVFPIFLVFPVFVIPYLERRFEERLPTMLPPDLADFVMIYRHGPAVSSLLRDMRRLQIPVAILEEDEALARRLRDRGFTVFVPGVEDEYPFTEGLVRARALVLNGEDHDNAVMVLAARQHGFEGPVYAFVQRPMHRKPMMLAGATGVYSPKHALAAALAAKASERISPRVAGLQQLGEHVEVAELRIQRDSPLVQGTLAEARVREQTGATIIGQWVGGEVTTEIGPHTTLRAGAIVVAIGSGESIERLGRMATPLHRSGPFLIAGNGEVGSRVVKMLVDAGEETVVIDNRPLPGVDFVMDALDPDALAQAGLASARAVILALSSDSTNLFAATIVRDMVPEVPIIARVNQGEDVTRIHAAGADFALSISQVAGQLLGRQLFGEEFISLEPQMRLAKASAAGLGGRDPASLRIREQSGCSLVAVERDGALDLEFDREFVFRDADILYLCGSAEAVGQYFELHPEGRKPGVDDPA